MDSNGKFIYLKNSLEFISHILSTAMINSINITIGDKMRSIIIPAIKSLTVTNRYPDKSLNEGVITVGSNDKYKYYSYLFFDISSIPCNVIISNAELVLFKVDKFYNDNSKKISISPLREDFSTYTTYNNAPNYDHCTTINFYPLTSKVSVTVNITTIISAWVKNKSNNKGIKLYEKSKDGIINFGSVKSDDDYLLPFIRVTYQHYLVPCTRGNYGHYVSPCIRGNCGHNPRKKCIKNDCNKKCVKICKEELVDILIKICKEICRQNCNPQTDATARQVRVTGTVAPLSIYLIIINLKVTRAGSGHKDNYYVCDKYDNHLNNDSLSIDKTYNIAIIPKVQHFDTENVTLYGSYKGTISIL
jgi:hypothetical protein